VKLAAAAPPGASRPESNMVVLILLLVLFAASWCAFIFWRLRSHPRHLAALGVASFSAALSGLVFALTVSLSVYYYQHSQATIELARIEQQHEDEARARIVTLTKRELSDNLAVIKSVKAAPNLEQAFTIMIRSPLKTEFWKSLLSSGDLKNIGDFDLLYSIAEAYAQVVTLGAWEDRLAEIATGSGSTISIKLPDGRSVGMFENVYGWIVPNFTTAEDAIGRAIGALDMAESSKSVPRNR
jgi:hypothetical protein